MKKFLRYFDKLEDRVRGRLSRYPIMYSIIGGTAIVLFWRGVWITTDEIAQFIPAEYIWIDGPLSVVASILILLVTGLFVSFFVTDRIIVSGLNQEKKIVEKTEEEVRAEGDRLAQMRTTLLHIEKEVEGINSKLH